MFLKFWPGLQIDDVLSGDIYSAAGNGGTTYTLVDILAKRQEQLPIPFNGLRALAFGTISQLIPFDELLYIQYSSIWHDIYPVAAVIHKREGLLLE